MANRHIIEVEHLVKKFGDFAALKDISFWVEEGEIFGFLGPNGAGKTTTINILCTLLKPTSGRAILNSYDVARQQSQVRQSIGLVFQDPSLDERLTALENLEFHAFVYNVPAKQRRQRMEEVLRLVELWERRDSLVKTLSGGMKRRLEIARGLLHYPKVLFLDEPTLGLDPQTRRRIWEKIHELREREGTTIFLTTHYMDEAENVNRIAIIDEGRIIAMDTPEALKQRVGEDIITLKAKNNEQAAAEIQERFHIPAKQDGDELTLGVPRGNEFIPLLVNSLETEVLSISLRRPTLDDVFLKMTGREIREAEVGEGGELRHIMRTWHRRGPRRH